MQEMIKSFCSNDTGLDDIKIYYDDNDYINDEEYEIDNYYYKIRASDIDDYDCEIQEISISVSYVKDLITEDEEYGLYIIIPNILFNNMKRSKLYANFFNNFEITTWDKFYGNAIQLKKALKPLSSNDLKWKGQSIAIKLGEILCEFWKQEGINNILYKE